MTKQSNPYVKQKQKKLKHKAVIGSWICEGKTEGERPEKYWSFLNTFSHSCTFPSRASRNPRSKHVLNVFSMKSRLLCRGFFPYFLRMVWLLNIQLNLKVLNYSTVVEHNKPSLSPLSHLSFSTYCTHQALTITTTNGIPHCRAPSPPPPLTGKQSSFLQSNKQITFPNPPSLCRSHPHPLCQSLYWSTTS